MRQNSSTADTDKIINNKLDHQYHKEQIGEDPHNTIRTTPTSITTLMRKKKKNVKIKLISFVKTISAKKKKNSDYGLFLEVLCKGRRLLENENNLKSDIDLENGLNYKFKRNKFGNGRQKLGK